MVSAAKGMEMRLEVREGRESIPWEHDAQGACELIGAGSLVCALAAGQQHCVNPGHPGVRLRHSVIHYSLVFLPASAVQSMDCFSGTSSVSGWKKCCGAPLCCPPALSWTALVLGHLRKTKTL